MWPNKCASVARAMGVKNAKANVEMPLDFDILRLGFVSRKDPGGFSRNEAQFEHDIAIDNAEPEICAVQEMLVEWLRLKAKR